MPDIIKKSGWNRQFKSHDKVNKRLMTGAEAAERDANNREQVAVRETRQETNIALTASFLTRPTPLAGPKLGANFLWTYETRLLNQQTSTT
jgi:hypothetical protein